MKYKKKILLFFLFGISMTYGQCFFEHEYFSYQDELAGSGEEREVILGPWFDGCDFDLVRFRDVPSWATIRKELSDNTFKVHITVAENPNSERRSGGIEVLFGEGYLGGVYLSQYENCRVYWWLDRDNDGFGESTFEGTALTSPVLSCTEPSPILGIEHWAPNNHDACPDEAGPHNGCLEVTELHENSNWTRSKTFAIDQTLLSSTKTYFNALGKATQTQTFDAKTERIWARQILYDSQGRPALQTLSAPISDRDKTTPETFQYKEDFIRNKAGAVFTSADFEGSPALEENPKEVQSRATTYDLGRQYSAHNTEEQWQDITTRPYTRTLYSTLNPGSVLKTIGGNKIDTDDDGVGDAWKQGFSYTFPAAQEMYYAFGVDGIEDAGEILDRLPEPTLSRPQNLWANGGLATLVTDYYYGSLDDVSNERAHALIAINGSFAMDFPLLEGVLYYQENEKKFIKAKGKPVYKQFQPGPSLLSTNTIVFQSRDRAQDFLDYESRKQQFEDASAKNNLINWLKATKTVAQDIHGIETVVFADTDGKTLATARAGGDQKYEVLSLIGTQKYVDIHIPVGCQNTLSFVGGSRSDFEIYDLRTEALVTTPNLNAGFYRIAYVGTEKKPQNYPNLTMIEGGAIKPVFEANAVGVRYQVNYYEYALQYYDRASRLVKSTQPLGFDRTALEGLKTQAQCTHSLATTFVYNALGQLIETTSPDEGTTEFLYRKDGQIRFSRNSKQRGFDKVIESNFTADFGGWVANGSTNPVIENGRLSVHVDASWEGIKHELEYFEVAQGQKYRMKIKFDKGNTQSAVRLYVQEQDADKNHLRWHMMSSDLQTGEHEFTYTVGSDAKKIILRLDKQNTNLDTETQFYVDYASFHRVYNDAKEFSYTHYDDLGRPVESGVARNQFTTENTATGNNALGFGDFNLVATSIPFAEMDPDSTSPIYNTKAEEKQETFYDLADAHHLEAALGEALRSYYTQTFVAGNVSKTQNEQTTTWYSYDIYGRVRWIVQKIKDLGVKTIDYEYHPVSGAVTKVDFQKHHSAERFVHRYTYHPISGELLSVATSEDGSNFTEQADYTYYETGALKRLALKGNDGAVLQGIDYTYNLAGQLKAINHPDLQEGNDPGGDANDAFGMRIDYYQGDYQRANAFESTPENAQGIDQYNGNIKAVTWSTHNQLGKQTYYYKYNKNNGLEAASLGNALEEGTTINDDDYAVYGLSYDANGNLQTLNRNKNTENNRNEMDRLGYVYKTDKPNQLLRVEDSVAEETHANDIKNQEGNNYRYNSIGQLTENVGEGIKYRYNASGLVTEVQKNNVTLIKIYYNDKGFRVRKESYDTQGNLANTQYYVRDVSGNVMAIYEGSTQVELPVYGASRLGVYKKGSHTNYELTDHLGNVRAVVSKGDYHEIINSSFTADFGGWVENGSVNYSLDGGRLKANVNTSWEGVRHELRNLTTSPGETFTVNLKFDKGNTESAVRLYFQEKDIEGNHLSWNVINGDLQTGVYQYDYTIKTGNKIFLRIDKDNTNTDIETYFYIDHVSLTQGEYEKVGQADYYPGGFPMPGRNVVGDYRYNYQGQELDPETGKVAFQLRLYDPRINRWLTTDPYGQFSSPYVGMGNDWVNGIDPDGGFWQELGNWLSGNGWNSNAALEFQAGGGTLAEWNGNVFTGYRRGYDDREGASIYNFRAVDDYGGHVINPIVNFPINFVGGVKDFHDEYSIMKNRNFKLSDKYFHSKANFKATLRGPGGEYAAEKLSNLREITDQRLKGDSRQSSLEDQEANKYGRERAKHYRLHGLDEKDINFKEAIPGFRPKYKGFPDDL